MTLAVSEQTHAGSAARAGAGHLLACAWIAAIACAPAFAQGVSFEGNRAFQVGIRPTDAALGDLNGDGRPDLVAVNRSSTYFSVLLNAGQGEFEPQTTVPYYGPITLSRVELGDLDGDGDLDVALTRAGPAPDNLLVYFNSGSGAFGGANLLPSASSVRDVEIGDLDGDGDLDIAVAGIGTIGFSIYRNQGGGTFGAAEPFGALSDANGLVLGDFDTDGDLDAAVGIGPEVHVLTNPGDGTFAAVGVLQALAIVMDLSFGDLDADGDGDLVTSNDGLTNQLSSFLNLGSGTFGPATVTQVPNELIGRAEVADIDADGDADLLVPLYWCCGISVFQSIGGGAFAPPVEYTAPDNAMAVAVADVDADGDLDVAVPCLESVLVAVLHGRGDGTFDGTPTIAARTESSVQAVVDLDADGDLDAVAVGTIASGLTGVSILFNSGDATFGPPATYPVGGAPVGLLAADIDGDGDVDLATARSNAASISVLRNQGNGAFVLSSFPTLSFPHSVVGGDFDLDGDVDLAMDNGAASGQTLWHRNLGNGAFGPAILVHNAGGRCVAGDLDGDGDADLLVNTCSTNYVYLASGGSFGAPILSPSGGCTNSPRLADVDGDGYLDFLRGHAPRHIAVCLNQGAGTFATPLVFEAGKSPNVADAVDLEGDGDLDLVSVNGFAHTMSVLENLGAMTFAPHRDWLVSRDSSSLSSGDLDGDGDVDLLVDGFDAAAILRNTFSTGFAFCAGDGASTACPCGNDSAPGSGAGCLNSLGGGGVLRASGSARLAHDTLVLRGSGMTNAAALYFQGTSQANGGLGAVFGDGLRCAAGTIVRLATKTNVAGESSYPGPTDERISVQGAVLTSGDRHYQVWYRNAASFCTASTFNLTNGWRVTWGL